MLLPTTPYGWLSHRDGCEFKMNVEHMIKLQEINPYVYASTYLFLPLPHTPLESYIINDMGFKLPCTLNDFEQARFEFKGGKKFRSWINDDRYTLLKQYYDVFKDAFQINNIILSENSITIIDENPLLKHIFGGIERVKKPSVFMSHMFRIGF